MKLGNSSRAMGVGAYFLKVFLWRGKLSGRSALGSEQVGVFWGVCASWRDGAMLKINNLYRGALLGTQVAIFSVCNEWRICSVWQVAWCGMDIWAIIHMSLSERCNLLPSSGGWFEERRGASRVVTNPTVWVRDRRVSIIDYCYRWRVSGIEFLSLLICNE